MANPALSPKRFEKIEKEDESGWAAPVALAHAEATGATVFCAGVAADPAGPSDGGDGLVTAGGRVLAVTGTGPTVAAARNHAYAAAGLISWRGMYHRTDIALEAST